jgi:hypothetical protein
MRHIGNVQISGSVEMGQAGSSVNHVVNGDLYVFGTIYAAGESPSSEIVIGGTEYPLIGPVLSGNPLGNGDMLLGYGTPDTSTIYVDDYVSNATKDSVENISELSNDIASKLYELKPVEYTKVGNELPSYGFMVEDVYKVLPDMVITNDGIAESVRLGNLTALLVKEIQNLNKRIELLEKGSKEKGD